MENIRILIADDEPEIRMIESRSMRSQGFKTAECADGQTAMHMILTQHFDLILLDLDMPGLDGFHILQNMREQAIDIPVIIVTANEEEYNEVFGFSLGADDYIIKPFRPSALSARVKRLLDRMDQNRRQSNVLTIGPFQMLLQNYTFFKNDIELPLTPKERQLLQYFMQNPNQVFSKEQLYQAVWNHSAVDDNTIMVTIRNLRQKIEDRPKEPKYLLTVYGLGYKFSVS